MHQNKLLPTPNQDTAPEPKATHNDSIYNAIVGLGKQADKSMQSRPGGNMLLSDVELTNIWQFNGLGKEIVTCVVDDAIRPGFTIAADTDGVLIKELERIGSQKSIEEACYWARLYGGSLIFKGYADGQEPVEPRTSTAASIDWLKCYSVTDIPLTGTEFETDPKKPNYEKPNTYPCWNVMGTPANIHYTRVIPIYGSPVANKRFIADLRRRYWGDSILNAMWERLAGLGGAMQGMDNLMMEFSIAVYKLQGLAQLASSGKGSKVIDRMTLMNMSKSLLRGIMLDSTEEFTRVSTPLSGVSDVLDRGMMMVSAVSQIPVTRLFGRSPAGLNATGDSDIRLYYDRVRVYQKRTLTPIYMNLLTEINRVMKVVPEKDLVLVWGDPNAPTQSELLEMRNKQANIDKIYMDPNSPVLGNDEVRASRFGGTGYSFDTKLDPDSEPPEVEATDEELDQGEAGKKKMPVTTK